LITVPEPLKRPYYGFNHTPTIDEMRQTAIRAMRDIITVQWTTEKSMDYRKEGSASDKHFQYPKDYVYCGEPYSNGNTGIFQWLKYYNEETGIFTFPGDGMQWSATLGTTCANCVCWGWNAVCSSLSGQYNTYTMTKAYGFIPLGYDYDDSITDYRNYSTVQICGDNGKEKILEAYTLLQPADALVSSGKGSDIHTVMVIEPITVVRREDGTVDEDNSYVYIQDQRGGFGLSFYDRVEGDTIFHATGRRRHRYLFKELWNLSYLPCTTAEFLGKAPYEKPFVTYEGPTDTPEGLAKGKLLTNHLICNVECVVTDAHGQEREVGFDHYRKCDVGMDLPRSFSLEKLHEVLKNVNLLPGDKAFGLDVTLATGDTFRVAEITLKEGKQ